MNATWPPSLAGNSGGTGGDSRQAGECHVGGRGLRRPLFCGFTQYRWTWSQPCRQATALRGARCFAPPPECLHVEWLDLCAKMRVRRREQTCKCVQIVVMTWSAFRSIAKFRSVQRVSFAADLVWRMQVLIFCTLRAAYYRRYLLHKVFPSYDRAIPGAFRASGATGTP